jgi:hypothetical protein
VNIYHRNGYNIIDPPGSYTNVKERTIMQEHKKNDHIKCSVSQCQHNMVTENYCGLNCISVGTHEDDPTVPECTDCNSFVKRTGCCE